LRPGLVSQIHFLDITAVDLRCGCEKSSDLVLFAIEEMGIVKLRSGLHFEGFGADESADFSGGGFVPGGFAIVGKNFGLSGESEFGVVAIGKFEIEGICARFGVALASEHALEGKG